MRRAACATWQGHGLLGRCTPCQAKVLGDPNKHKVVGTIGGGSPPMAILQTNSVPLDVAPHFSSGRHCSSPKADAPLLVGIAADRPPRQMPPYWWASPPSPARCPPIGGHRRCRLPARCCRAVAPGSCPWQNGSSITPTKDKEFKYTYIHIFFL